MQTLKLSNTEFEGRNNAYLLDGADSTALIDTGIATTGIREQLEEGLADSGYTFADVDDVVLTHWHPDHAGLAGAIQEAGDATVYVHEADAPLVRQEQSALDEMREQQLALFEEWGMPPEKREEVLERLDRSDELAGRPADVVALEDGDTVSAGGRTFHVHHAPGHTAGLSCFEFESVEGREAFVGDVILPEYTPNVGGADVRVEEPLDQYLDTLSEISGREYARVWPGHRDVIEAPADRAETIVEHHHERTQRVLDTLDTHGPADAWTVSAHLFGELHGIHVLHGPGEAYAHLDWLQRRGVVAVTDGEYELVESDPDPAQFR